MDSADMPFVTADTSHTIAIGRREMFTAWAFGAFGRVYWARLHEVGSRVAYAEVWR